MRTLRSFDLTVNHLTKYPITLVQGHQDPKHGDIVINGYGVKKKQLKALRDWCTQAIRHSK